MNLVQQYDVQHSLFSIDQFRAFKKRRHQLIAIKSNNIIVTSITEQNITTISRNIITKTRRFVRRKRTN